MLTACLFTTIVDWYLLCCKQLNIIRYAKLCCRYDPTSLDTILDHFASWLLYIWLIFSMYFDILWLLRLFSFSNTSECDIMMVCDTQSKQFLLIFWFPFNIINFSRNKIQWVLGKEILFDLQIQRRSAFVADAAKSGAVRAQFVKHRRLT